MKDITVLLTAAGYFGANTLVENLKNNKERQIRVIGTDINSNSTARRYCDRFYEVPGGKDPEFIPAIKQICSKENVDVILPASSYDIYQLAFHRKEFKAEIMVSSTATSEITLDKFKTYQRLSGIVPLPSYFYSYDGFVVKSTIGKGGREVEVFRQKNCLVMEKLSGEEIDVDVLSYNREVLLTIFKIRERTYGGTLVEGTIVDRPYLREQIEKIVKEIPFQYLSVIQFMGGKLLEINPRIAGAVPYFDWNMPYLAIKLALGEITPEEVKRYESHIPFGTKMYRYLEQAYG